MARICAVENVARPVARTYTTITRVKTQLLPGWSSCTDWRCLHLRLYGGVVPWECMHHFCGLARLLLKSTIQQASHYLE